MKRRLVIALICALTLLAVYVVSTTIKDFTPRHRRTEAGYRVDNFISEPNGEMFTPSPTPTPKPAKAALYYENVIEGVYLDNLEATYQGLKLESLGKHYITAYDPYECGYNGSNYPKGWTTASDTICFRASYEERLTKPTTCAIDPKLYKFGTLFYIAEFDRVFEARDTGGAVRGKHLDLFYETHADTIAFKTGYYIVYSVEYYSITFTANDYNVIKVSQQEMIDKSIKEGL